MSKVFSKPAVNTRHTLTRKILKHKQLQQQQKKREKKTIREKNGVTEYLYH